LRPGRPLRSGGTWIAAAARQDQKRRGGDEQTKAMHGLSPQILVSLNTYTGNDLSRLMVQSCQKPGARPNGGARLHRIGSCVSKPRDFRGVQDRP
jgi:hypothetical protein